MRYDHFSMLPERAFQRIGRRMTLEGGKGGSPPAPDYTPVANASKEAAELGAQLGREQLAENRRQYDANMAVAAPIIQAQTGLMNQSIKQGDDYYNYMKDTFRPIEQSLADEAATGSSRYNTNAEVRANVEQEASRAAADTQRGLANAQAQNARAMSSMGVNPNSGRFASLKVGEGLQAAAMRAGAQTGARQKGVALDYAKRMDAAGLGRNLPGASQGAYGLALNSGNAAVGNQNGTSAQYMNGMSAGNGLIMQGQGMKVQGLGSVLGAQTSAYNSANALAGQESAAMGQMVGTAGGLAAVAKFSDIRLKENIVAVGRYKNGLTMYEFNYIGNETRYRGVMAQEVMLDFPEAVITLADGMYAVDYDKLGIAMEKV